MQCKTNERSAFNVYKLWDLLLRRRFEYEKEGMQINEPLLAHDEVPKQQKCGALR